MQKSLDSGNVRAALVLSAIGAVSLAADLLTKSFFKNHALLQGSYFFGWLSFTSHQNYGLLADIQLPFAILIAINAAAFAALAYGLYWSWNTRSIWQMAFLGLVLGGALGNLYDRLSQGYVFDWILLFKTSVVNLADIWITLGIIGYLICLSTTKHKPENPNPPVNCQECKTSD
ncbi:MAG: signal peptidase II [Patescibacteria group bacterium]|jgi:signal peptidase II